MQKQQQQQIEEKDDPLKRLTLAYSAAMAAVGSLHKANAAIVKKIKKKQKKDRKRERDDGEKEKTMDIVGDASKKHSGTNKRKPMGKEIEENNDAIHSLQRVAMAARKAFENVLSDPLISTYAPTVLRIMNR
jgi:hypothetical protein